MKKDYQTRTTVAATTVAAQLPEAVSVTFAELAGSLREGLLLALAVGAGFKVMEAIIDESVTTLAGPKGRHDRTGAPYAMAARCCRLYLHGFSTKEEEWSRVVDPRSGIHHSLTGAGVSLWLGRLNSSSSAHIEAGGRCMRQRSRGSGGSRNLISGKPFRTSHG